MIPRPCLTRKTKTMDEKQISRIRSYYYGHRMYSELQGFDIGLRLFADNEQKKKNFWQKHKGKILTAAALAGLGGLAYANKDTIDAVLRMGRAIPGNSSVTGPVTPEPSDASVKQGDKRADEAASAGNQGADSKQGQQGQPSAPTPAEGSEKPASGTISLGDYPDGERADHVLHKLNKIMGGGMDAEKRKCKAYCDMVTRFCSANLWGSGENYDAKKHIQDLGKVDAGLSKAGNILKSAAQMESNPKLSKHYEDLAIQLDDEVRVVRVFAKGVGTPAGTHF